MGSDMNFRRPDPEPLWKQVKQMMEDNDRLRRERSELCRKNEKLERDLSQALEKLGENVLKKGSE